jgi:ketosteroid isomerase-like protein
MRNAYVASILALLGAACQPAQETPEQAQARMQQEAAAARQVIDEAAARFGRLLSEGKADSVALFYAEEATLMPPNESPVSGREGIRQWLTNMSGMGGWSLTLTPVAVAANGPLAVERGSYALSFTPGPSTPRGMTAMADTGKYLVHWHQVGSEWLIVEDIWNSNRPVQPAAGGR